jgi:hypothetical protein
MTNKLENQVKDCQKINELGNYPCSSTVYYSKKAKKWLVIKDVELKKKEPKKFGNYEQAYSYAYSLADLKEK